jgi:DNA-directed RNA polymerase specialized sigma24 family protein
VQFGAAAALPWNVRHRPSSPGAAACRSSTDVRRYPERRRALPSTGIERDRRLLEAGLATFEGPQRVSLALHLEGLDYSEMANTLGIPITAARNRLLVVREYLRRSLFPEDKR